MTSPGRTRITGGTVLPLYANALRPVAESYVATSVNGPLTSGGSATTCCCAHSGITIQNAFTMKTTTFIHTSNQRRRVNELRLVLELRPTLRTLRLSGGERPRRRSARDVQSRTFPVSARSPTIAATATRAPPVSGWHDAPVRHG